VILDRFVEQRLGHGGVVHFTVPVTTIADHVDHDVGAEGVAIFERDASYADDRVHVFRVYVEDGNRTGAAPGRQRSVRSVPRVAGGEATRLFTMMCTVPPTV